MNNTKFKPNSGFSLVEMLVVIVLTSVALAVTIPGMVNFVYRQRLNTANREIYQAIRSTQSEATRRKEIWQLSIRDHNGVWEWGKHNQSTPSDKVQWNELNEKIELDQSKTDPLAKQYDNKLSDYVWRFRFDNNGYFMEAYPGQLAQAGPSKITLKLAEGVGDTGFAKRCVFIDTVIGATRVEKDKTCG